MLDYVLFILLIIFLSLVAAGVMLTLFQKQLAFNERIETYFGNNHLLKEKVNVEDRKKTSKLSMIFMDYWKIGIRYLNKKVSRSEKKKLDLLLRDAGYPIKSALDFRLMQILLAAALGLPIILSIAPFIDNKASGWFLGLAVAFLGFRYPIFYLGKKKTARIKAINKAMPDYFDTVNLLLEAGMGLDIALANVCQQTKGPLSDEFTLTLEDMKLGKSRREAFYDLRKRVPSDSFQSVINALIQADQLGIGMAKVLGNLTTRIREQQREAARSRQ